MIEVQQTILKPPTGNCHAACIASILELPLRAVPSLYDGADADGYDRDAAYKRQHDWLHGLGLNLLYVECTADSAEKWPGWCPDGYWIATHEPPSKLNHSTVWLGDTLAWDPWPVEPIQPGEPVRGDLVMVEWFECRDPALLARMLPSLWLWTSAGAGYVEPGLLVDAIALGRAS